MINLPLLCKHGQSDRRQSHGNFALTCAGVGGGVGAEPAGSGGGQAGLGHCGLPPERPAALGGAPPLLLERPRHLYGQVDICIRTPTNKMDRYTVGAVKTETS